MTLPCMHYSKSETVKELFDRDVEKELCEILSAHFNNNNSTRLEQTVIQTSCSRFFGSELFNSWLKELNSEKAPTECTNYRFPRNIHFTRSETKEELFGKNPSRINGSAHRNPYAYGNYEFITNDLTTRKVSTCPEKP